MAIISLSFMLFVAIVMLFYFMIPMKARPYLLLASSIFFYACFDLKYFVFLGITVVSTFVTAHLTAKDNSKINAKLKKIITATTIIFNAGLLVTVKFLNYSVSLINKIFNIDIMIVSLPVALGIAFYTMQAISYSVDIYKGKYAPEKNFFKFLLYMTYFPIIMQGPISRYDQLADQLFTPQRFSFERFKSGMSLVLWGMFKKMVIADRAAILVNQVFNNYADYRGFEITIAVLLYTLQIYTDFSGFVDISRGISTVFGIELADNFKHPYFSDSIKDFWRRWHISLSSWFRDYIYIPLGGSRKGTLRKYINILIVFFISGLWHGVGIHYMVWGLMQGVFQITGDLTQRIRNNIYDRCGVNKNTFSYKLGKQIFTFILVNISWLFFRANGFIAALKMLKSSFMLNPWILTDGSILEMGLDGKDWNILIIAVAVLLIISILQQKFSIREKLEEQAIWFRYTIYIVAIFSILIFGIYGPGYSESQFIYMQF